jgi:hypothetical protein
VSQPNLNREPRWPPLRGGPASGSALRFAYGSATRRSRPFFVHHFLGRQRCFLRFAQETTPLAGREQEETGWFPQEQERQVTNRRKPAGFLLLPSFPLRAGGGVVGVERFFHSFSRRGGCEADGVVRCRRFLGGRRPSSYNSRSFLRAPVPGARRFRPSSSVGRAED